MYLVVGLGNPGKKYEGTRHNVGFELIELLARRHAAAGPRLKFDGVLFECSIGGSKVLLLKPSTFMNLSGGSVLQAVGFYKIDLGELLVVCDDFHLPLGTIRLRASGTDGGQKGLADTIRRLSSDEFARLRLGIGPVPESWNPADFVLGKFRSDEQELVEGQVARAADAVETWIADGVTVAMNRFNGSLPESG